MSGGRLGEGRGVGCWCGAVEGLCASAMVDTGLGVGGIIFCGVRVFFAWR